MNTFAGFWRDGAVVWPVPKHFDIHNKLIVKDKEYEYVEMLSLNDFQGSIANYYWLDTTTPTKLTPKQAFELCKALFPKVKRIIRDSAFAIAFDCNGETVINWGSTTEYPPRERWRVPTDADKGKRCRVRISLHDSWTESNFLVTDGDKFLARGDCAPYAYPYAFCEVLE